MTATACPRYSETAIAESVALFLDQEACIYLLIKNLKKHDYTIRFFRMSKNSLR